MVHSVIFLFSFLLLSIVCKGETSGKAEYVGGTVAQCKAGLDGRLHTSAPGMVFLSGKTRVEISYDRINLLEYGQNASRRIVMAVLVSPIFLLSKARRHFLTVGFQDADGKQQALVLRLDKTHVRGILASLEARTGLRVQYQDEESRKSGRG